MTQTLPSKRVPQSCDCERLSNPGDVYLNVYDLGSYTQPINSLARAFDWGLFHVGVQVFGHEWCFERTFGPSMPGVSAYRPQQHGMHRFRETVHLGTTALAPE